MILQSHSFVRSRDKVLILYISTNTGPMTTKHDKVGGLPGGAPTHKVA